MTPSERITQLARENHELDSIDPYFNGNVPDIADYLNAIITYLDEKETSHGHG